MNNDHSNHSDNCWQPGKEAEEGVEGDEGDGDADKDPDGSSSSPPVCDVVNVPGGSHEHENQTNWKMIRAGTTTTTETHGSKW